MSRLLAIHDPTGRLSLTDPSPGGGAVPVVWTCLGCRRIVQAGDECCPQQDRYHVDALLLVTADGTPDPVGMARAREVLARVLGAAGAEGGVYMHREGWHWHIYAATGRGPLFARHFEVPPETEDESAPEALARLLAEHAGVEVICG